ncbi:MAG: GTPase Era [Clostridia bacterium]|nr:GTPase Era [Clostridia bacterium]
MTKTAFIAIVGRPNVGKSTLLNTICGEKIAIVSNKPQTTRNRITGILTKGENQYVFLDTPGMHKPRTALGDFMVKTANGSIGESDVTVLVVEPVPSVGDIEKGILERIKTTKSPCILVVNKVDEHTPVAIAETIAAYSADYSFDAVVPLCAKSGKGINGLFEEVDKFLYESVWYFPEDAITDQPERQIVAEVIREKLLRTLNKEIPHGTAVVIEEFKDDGKILRIRAEIFCERDSHKGIIVGKNGSALKLVGTYARQDLESFFGTKVYLNLWVKVKENWRDSAASVGNFGYRDE